MVNRLSAAFLKWTTKPAFKESRTTIRSLSKERVNFLPWMWTLDYCNCRHNNVKTVSNRQLRSRQRTLRSDMGRPDNRFNALLIGLLVDTGRLAMVTGTEEARGCEDGRLAWLAGVASSARCGTPTVSCVGGSPDTLRCPLCVPSLLCGARGGGRRLEVGAGGASRRPGTWGGGRRSLAFTIGCLAAGCWAGAGPSFLVGVGGARRPGARRGTGGAGPGIGLQRRPSTRVYHGHRRPHGFR